jgi:uncharacterized membrane protein
VGTKFLSHSDLFHFSTVIGMTFQIADIVTFEPKIRSLVTMLNLFYVEAMKE